MKKIKQIDRDTFEALLELGIPVVPSMSERDLDYECSVKDTFIDGYSFFDYVEAHIKGFDKTDTSFWYEPQKWLYKSFFTLVDEDSDE